MKIVLISVYLRLTLRTTLAANHRNYGNMSYSKCRLLKTNNNVNVILNANRRNTLNIRKTQSSAVCHNITDNTHSRLMSSFPSFSSNNYEGIN